MKYIMRNDLIERISLREFARAYCEETTAPVGVSPKYHQRGSEVWSWGHQGNRPHQVAEFATKREAAEHLYEIWLDEATSATYAPSLFDSLAEIAGHFVDAIKYNDGGAREVAALADAQDRPAYRAAILSAASAAGFTKKQISEARQENEAERAAQLVQQAERSAEIKRLQSAAARKDAQAAAEIADRLKIENGAVVFDGNRFVFEKLPAGNIRIDRGLNAAARAAGLTGQAVGEFYSLAQKLASQAA